MSNDGPDHRSITHSNSADAAERDASRASEPQDAIARIAPQQSDRATGAVGPGSIDPPIPESAATSAASPGPSVVESGTLVPVDSRNVAQGCPDLDSRGRSPTRADSHAASPTDLPLSFTEVVDAAMRAQGRVLEHLRRRGLARHAADALGDAMITIVQNGEMPAFRSSHEVLAFLRCVATRRAIDGSRRSARFDALAEDHDDPKQPTVDRPDDEDDARLEAIHRHLERLTQAERDLLSRTGRRSDARHRLSAAERQQLVRLRDRLRAYVETECADPPPKPRPFVDAADTTVRRRRATRPRLTPTKR